MKPSVRIQLKVAVWLLIAGGFFAYFIYYQVSKNLGNSPLTNQLPDSQEIFYSPLNGLQINSEQKDLVVAAIMIENHIDSRPPSGLAQAKIVYEVLTEATITRFLAIYDLSEALEKIGPVRSARPYFIDLAAEYKGLYAHSGGSPAALTRLKNEETVFNLDEFFGYNSGYFWRDSKRTAPHNLYTSSALLLEAKNNYQLLNKSDFLAWKFKDNDSAANQDSEIKINYSETLSHQVMWKYQASSNKYERWQSGKRHIDDQGNIIEADNVVIQYANTITLDEIGRKDIDLIGQGQALIFRDSSVIKGRWQKEGISKRTIFFDNNDQEIEFNRGPIWIEIVPTTLEISYNVAARIPAALAAE